MPTPQENAANAINAGAGLSPAVAYASGYFPYDNDGVTSGAISELGSRIFLFPITGPEKVPLKGGDGKLIPYRLRVDTYGPPGDMVQAETDANAVYNFLDFTPFSPYFEIECDGAQPLYLNRSKLDEHLFIFDLTLWERTA